MTKATAGTTSEIGMESGTAYAPLLNALRGDIRKGRIKPMQFLPGEKSLSRQYKISRWAVREALDVLVRERVLRKIPGKGTIVAGQVETTGRPPHKTRLQIIVDTTMKFDTNVHALKYMGHLKRLAPELPIPVELDFQFLDFSGADSEGQQAVERGGADVAIVVPFSRQCEQFLEAYHPGNAPMFCLGRQLVNEDIPQVYVDHQAGVHKAMDHLLRLGHRHIVMITPPAGIYAYIPVRENAFVEALQGVVEMPEDWIYENDLDMSAMQAVLERRWSQPEPPTAIFVGDGNLLPMVRHGLADRGLMIGRDVSLVTYDDLEPDVYDVAITAVRQPLKVIIRRLFDAVVARQLGKPISARQMVVPELIVRESCAALK